MRDFLILSNLAYFVNPFRKVCLFTGNISPLNIHLILIPPHPGGNLINILKCPGKMKLVVIAHGLADIADGKLGQLQKLRGLCHAVIQQKILGRPSHHIFKDLSEIAAVQPAVIRDILHGNIVLEILLDKNNGFMYIKIPEFSGFGGGKSHGGNGPCQGIQKKIHMAHKMKGRHFTVLRYVQHFLHHGLPNIVGARPVYRRIRRKPGQRDGLLNPQSVKFNPDVFPGKLLVRNIGSDLVWKNHESLSAFNLILLCFSR